MKVSFKNILILVLFTVLLVQCQRDINKSIGEETIEEPSLEEALKEWPEMPQQITFIGLKNCLTKFQVYWNGAVSCFVGRDCFGNVFPPQEKITQLYEQDQLHMTFAGGDIPDFPMIDSGQVSQTLLDGYLPIIETTWSTSDISYSIQTFATSLVPEELNPASVAGMTLGMMCVTINAPEDLDTEEVHLWINFSGYKILVPTDKELPDDVFPPYGRKLHLESNKLIDDKNRIRAVIDDLPPESAIEFFDEFNVNWNLSAALKRSQQKGFFKNLLHIRIPCKHGEKVNLVIVLPYFPIEADKEYLLNRNYDTELNDVKQYWQYFYRQDAVLITPDSFVNNFYRAGLWHTLVTADQDPETGMTYAKLSPAWYETFWPNCTMIVAISLDMRGYHTEAARYLEPFLDWQSVREPPNMPGVSKGGFLCPPKDFCPIPWVSNHGNTLWALCEHYRMTSDSLWGEKITDIVLKACDWIIAQRKLTMKNDLGSGLMPGGTVSDDKGAGQYLCTDAQTYRGLRSAADFLKSTGHKRAEEIDKAAISYRNDIQKALFKSIERTDRITLIDGKVIPYVPSEIHQTRPPEFNMDDFWPYINYADVGPMHLIDCDVVESNSDIARWIYGFESKYQIALLRNEISLTENWVHSIRYEGNVPAYLLHHGISTMEPFYSPRSTMFFKNDQVEEYVNLYYHQLAAGVSHKNLSPCENRYGVWFLPWADAEFHRMLLRMMVHHQDDKLVLLKAIPRRWLDDDEQIKVENQPTEYGIINFHVISKLNDGFIEMTLIKPEETIPGGIDIRFRHPQDFKIKALQIDGEPSNNFEGDYVHLKNSSKKKVQIKVSFYKSNLL